MSRTPWRLAGVLGAVAAVAVAVFALSGVGLAKASGSAVVIGGSRPEPPAVSGSRVVYADMRGASYDVFVYDAGTGRTSRVTEDGADQLQVAVDGDTVAWTDYRNIDADIYAYNLATGELRIASVDKYFPSRRAAGDQVAPAVGGRWIAYEDRSSGYNPRIRAYDWSTKTVTNIDSGASVDRGMPRIGGQWLVYQERFQAENDPRYDWDVIAYNLETKARLRIGAAEANETLASTDGSYVAWVEDAPGGGDIKGYDLAAGRTVTIAVQPGEQTAPWVAGGVAYWLDYSGSQHVDSYDFRTGARAVLNTYGTGEVAALAGDDGNLAWLERYRSKWRVRGLFSGAVASPDPLTAKAPLALTVGVPDSVSSAGLADLTAPSVVAVSVTPGQTGVDGATPLSVTFSEEVDASTIDVGSVRLVDLATRRTVLAAVSYSTLTRTATLDPLTGLGGGSYALVVGTGVTDLAGNPLVRESATAFSTAGIMTATSFAPGDVTDPAVSVLTGDRLQITWSAVADDIGVTGYVVKRSLVPVMGDAGWAAAELVTQTVSAGYVVPAANAVNDKAKRFVYYYAVRALDGDSQLSASWLSIVADPHGTTVAGSNTSVCLMCHSMHADPNKPVRPKLSAKAADACYECHGSTEGQDAYGARSSMDTQARFNDDVDHGGTAAGGATVDVAGDGGVGNEGWSIHRNKQMTQNAEECNGCHGTHKKPYNESPIGTWSASTSYSKLLRANPSYVATYFRTTEPLDYGQKFCWGCHGTNAATYMANIAGGMARSNSAGDHEAGYETGAHNSSAVLWGSRPASDPGPNISCAVCHNKHASPVNGLVDYRVSNTSSKQYGESGICFQCHAAAGNGGVETIAVGGKTAGRPYTWNDRDVKAQFAKASHHPTSSSAPYVDLVRTVLTETAYADFTGPGHLPVPFRTEADLSGFVRLSNTTPITTVIPAADYLFFTEANTTLLVDAIPTASASTASWNAAGDFTPAIFPTGNAPGAGAKGVSFGSPYSFALRGGGNNTVMRYTEPADAPGPGSWAAVANTLWGNANEGSAFVKDTAHGYIWALLGGDTPSSGTDSNVRRTSSAYTAFGDNPAWQTGGPTIYDTQARRLGGGADLMWVPAGTNRPERLYAVFKDGTGSFATNEQGRLHYRDNPDSATGGTAWSDTSVYIGTTNGTNDTGTRMVYFRVNGVDYFYAMRGASTTQFLYSIADDAAGTLTAITSSTHPFGANPGTGSDLVWNGDSTTAGFRVYAMRGGTQNTWRIGAWDSANRRITWSTPASTLPVSSRAGSYFNIVRVDKADIVVPQFYAYGEFSVEASAPAWSTRWDKVTWTENNQASANVTLTAQGWDGSGWTALASGDNGATGLDLSAHSTAAYPKVRLTAGLSTSDAANTARLEDWTLRAAGPVQAAGTVTCVNCHNVHKVQRVDTTNFWRPSRVSNPIDTTQLYANAGNDLSDFCLGCHKGSTAQGSPPAKNVGAVDFVPYSVAFQPIGSAWTFFPGWSKAQTNLTYKASGHFTATDAAGRAMCQTCHDPHGSDNRRLLAWSYRTGITWNRAPSNTNARDNSAAAASEEALCYKCHGPLSATGAPAGSGKASGAADIFVAWNSSTTYRHPIGSAGAHRDTETSADLGTSNRHAECVDCHDPHSAKTGAHVVKSSQAGNVLLGAWGVRPTSWPSVTVSGGDASLSAISSTSYATERIDGQATDAESYLCFKCHSGYVTRPNSPSGGFAETDLAAEFNPNNQSGHNVVPGSFFPKRTTTGANGFDGLPYNFGSTSMPSLNLSAEWDSTTPQNNKMTCSDCHTYNAAGAKGPHGSTAKYLLAVGLSNMGTKTEWYEASLSEWGSASTAMFICKKCHTNMTSNNAHNEGSNHPQCQTCHVRIPHGWVRPRLLRRRLVDPLPYNDSSVAGLEYIWAQAYTTGNVPDGQCKDNCEHSNTGTPWP